MVIDYCYFYELEHSIKQHFKKIDSDIDRWKELFLDENRKEYWIIDLWDKYQIQTAIKIDSKDNWKNLETIEYEKKLLLKSRGGNTSGTCVRTGCKCLRVKGVVYCIDHLYELINRK